MAYADADADVCLCVRCIFSQVAGGITCTRTVRFFFLRPGPDTLSIRPAGAIRAIFFSVLFANEIYGNVGKIICQTWSGSDLMIFLVFLFLFFSSSSSCFVWFVVEKKVTFFG